MMHDTLIREQFPEDGFLVIKPNTKHVAMGKFIMKYTKLEVFCA